MRRSPRRPLILKRRKLPFQLNEPAESKIPHGEPDAKRLFPDGIRIIDHPSLSDTQVVVIPKSADLQSVIGALSAKGKESGVQGPNKFILLGGNEDSGNESLCLAASGGEHIPNRSTDGPELAQHPPEDKYHPGFKLLHKDGMDDSLNSVQWLDKRNTCEDVDEDAQKAKTNMGNSDLASQSSQNEDCSGGTPSQPISERPPYSYMAMIQFAINSRGNRMMTLKEIYTWIEDHFPYYKDVAKPGWKNSIRHNLSLHDMFIRETSLDGKVSFWTIRPEANRCLTLDQVYKPGCDPMTTPVPVPLLVLPHQQQKRILPDIRKPQNGSERRMKPLLPRTDSYLVPIQLPVTSSLYLPTASASSSSSLTPSPFGTCVPPQKQNTSRGSKRVRIAPKVTKNEALPVAISSPAPQMTTLKLEVKEEPEPLPIECETPKCAPSRQASSSRRKQCLFRSVPEEPVLLCPDSSFFDSGVVSTPSMLQDVPKDERDESQLTQDSPDREFSFKTPIKSRSAQQLSSSTPSKTPCGVAPEPWRVTPLGKRSQTLPDCSPIRTPNGPPSAASWFDYTTLGFCGTPFNDWPLFNTSGEMLTPPPSRLAASSADTPAENLQRSFSRESPANRSVTEGLVLDTMNDSLSKILVDISFGGLDEDDLGLANISWSEFFPQLK